MAKTLAILSGAGISAQSGIPTFVEIPNLRDKLSRDYYYEHRRDFFDTLLSMKRTCDAAQPNQAHLAIANYHVPVVTMNIDGLHVRAGTTDVCEIHGNLRDIFCTRCGKQYGYDVVETSTKCPACGGDLNPDIVLYGDSIPKLYDALKTAAACDTLLVVGTSFYTSTASYVVEAAKRAGRKVELINEDAARLVPIFLKEYFK